MSGSAKLARAKRRHRADRRHGRAGSALASLSVLVLLIGLMSIVAYGWMVRTGRIDLRPSDLPLLQKAATRARVLADAARSVLLHDGDLSLPGSYLVQSVLPSSDSHGPAAVEVPPANESNEPSVELLPLLASVGEIMTSGVIADPLKTVSSQVPLHGADCSEIQLRSFALMVWRCFLSATSGPYLPAGWCAQIPACPPEPRWTLSQPQKNPRPRALMVRLLQR